MTSICAHPGCMAQLSRGNVSGVCKAHMHGPACRCAACRAPRKVNRKGKTVRNVQNWQVKPRAQMLAEGLLLPGFLTPINPQKGSR
jgi:hypothetical protein